MKARLEDSSETFNTFGLSKVIKMMSEFLTHSSLASHEVFFSGRRVKLKALDHYKVV